MGTADVVTAIRATAAALVGLDWRPFDQTAALRFRSHAGNRFSLRLDGVHLFAARQSLLGPPGYLPPSEQFADDWAVLYFDVLAGGEFLDRFLAGQLGLPSQVVPYSLNGAGMGSAGFVRPVHLSLMAGGGNLDVVCEVVQLAGSDPHAESSAAAHRGGM
jgi:hypothetical protein